MTLPVWLVHDHGFASTFVAAPTRGQARWAVAADQGLWGDEVLALRVSRVLADGTVGGRGQQATIEAPCACFPSERDLAALGWRVCSTCEEYYTHNEGGVCDGCMDEIADEAELYAAIPEVAQP